MALRLLALDLPPLVRDLVARALLRRDAEGVFIDLPGSGGNVQTLALAAQADAVITPLDADGWPPYCARLVAGGGLPLVGLNWNEGSGRISELRAVESRRTGHALAGLTADDVVEAAVRAACASSQLPSTRRP